MAENSWDLPQVADLTFGFVEGALDDAEVDRLHDNLRLHPEAISALINAAMLHDMLISQHQNAMSETAARELLGSMQLDVSAVVPELAELQSAVASTPRAAVNLPHREPQSAARLLGFLHNTVTHRATVVVTALAVSLLIAISQFVRTVPQDVAMVTKLYGTPPVGNKVRLGTRLVTGDRIHLDRGVVEVTFDSGAVIAIKGPGDLEIVSSLVARSRRGTIAVEAGEHARGFTVETPSASVVDWGTKFGVSVKESETDVVVFDGAVDLLATTIESRQTRPKRMTQGEALRVSLDGTVRRIVSVNNIEFPLSNSADSLSHATATVIASVSDNIRGNQTSKCYRIVHGGLREDAIAYVDRSHQWNGLTSAGLPRFLIGADYVMPFNDDKRKNDLEVSVTFARDADVYVFFDARGEPPSWLQDRMEDTGAEIGLDEGPSTMRRHWTTRVGPGVSIDNRFRVWRCKLRSGETLCLGPQGENVAKGAHAMYGIAATAAEN